MGVVTKVIRRDVGCSEFRVEETLGAVTFGRGKQLILLP